MEIWLGRRYITGPDIWLDYTFGCVGDLDGFCWDGYFVGLGCAGLLILVGDYVLLKVGDLAGLYFWFGL